jgi:flagellar biogenesis protein FliO
MLGGIAWLIIRKLPPKMAAGKSEKIAVSDSVNLGSGRALHLVEVEGGRKILIGVTNENINTLAELESEVGP